MTGRGWDAGRRRRARRMRVLPAPGPGRGRRGAEGAAAGCLRRGGEAASRGGASAASAWHSGGRRGPKLFRLVQGLRGGPPCPPRRDVTVRLSLRRGATSVSGYPSKFAQVSRPPAHSNAHVPHTKSGPARLEPGAAACSPWSPPRRYCSASLPRGSAGHRLLLCLLLHTPRLLQPQKLSPKFHLRGWFSLSLIGA